MVIAENPYDAPDSPDSSEYSIEIFKFELK